MRARAVGDRVSERAAGPAAARRYLNPYGQSRSVKGAGCPQRICQGPARHLARRATLGRHNRHIRHGLLRSASRLCRPGGQSAKWPSGRTYPFNEVKIRRPGEPSSIGGRRTRFRSASGEPGRASAAPCFSLASPGGDMELSDCCCRRSSAWFGVPSCCATAACLGGSLAVLLAGICFSHPFFNVPLGPLPLTLDRAAARRPGRWRPSSIAGSVGHDPQTDDAGRLGLGGVFAGAAGQHADARLAGQPLAAAGAGVCSSF